MEFLEPLQVIWDYLGMHQTPTKADCIVGFGNFNTNIARRAAELYHQGYAPRILFTGGLGRNTTHLFTEPEAVRFAKVAMECGVPEADIILEDKSTNTKENIDFMREIFEKQGIPHDHVLGVHQPFMEAKEQGMTENPSGSVLVGDLQRIALYAKLGQQTPQVIPEECWEAYHKLVAMGFDKQLAK